MPGFTNLHAFLGAAVLGVISAAGLYLVEHYRHEKNRQAMARSLTRLDLELAQVKKELKQLMNKTQEDSDSRSKSRTRSTNRSRASSRSSDGYRSANLDSSSDIEFYDLSDNDDARDIVDIPILKQIDDKLDSNDPSEWNVALKKLESLLEDDPQNPYLLYRIGKAYYKLSGTKNDGDFAKRLVDKGYEACRTALVLDDNSAEVHKWYAVLTRAKGQFLGVRERLEHGEIFKKHIKKAILLDDTDRTLFHLLGKYHFEVVTFDRFEKEAAKTMDEYYPNSTIADALNCFKRAEELSGKAHWKENRLMIAKCLIEQGDILPALNYLEIAEKYSPNCPDEKVNLEVRSLLEQYRNYK